MTSDNPYEAPRETSEPQKPPTRSRYPRWLRHYFIAQAALFFVLAGTAAWEGRIVAATFAILSGLCTAALLVLLRRRQAPTSPG